MADAVCFIVYLTNACLVLLPLSIYICKQFLLFKDKTKVCYKLFNITLSFSFEPFLPIPRKSTLQ